MVRAVIGKAPRRRELVLVRGVHGELAAVPPGTVAGCGVRGWAVVGPRHCGVERHSSAGGCKVEVRDRDLAGRARAPPAATPPPPPPPDTVAPAPPPPAQHQADPQAPAR